MIHHPNGRIERGETPLWRWNLGKAFLWLFWGAQILGYIWHCLYGPYGWSDNNIPGMP
jgi:hypothetical protein